MPIDKNLRKQHIQFSIELLRILKNKYGQDFKRKVLSMVGFNPYIEISVKNYKTETIPNELRHLIVKTLNITPLSWEDIEYGNIRKNYVTLHYKEWLKVVENLGINYIRPSPESERNKFPSTSERNYALTVSKPK